MPKNGKGAIFVLLTLLAAMIVATVTVARQNSTRAVPLLVETALLAAAMMALSAYTAYKLWRMERNRQMAFDRGVPTLPTPAPWRWLSRRQWSMLTLGLTAIVTVTGAFAGLDVMNTESATTGATGLAVTPTATFTPIGPPIAVEPSTPDTDGSPSPFPSPSDSPSAEPATSPTTDDSASDTDSSDGSPEPTTAYLDGVQPVNDDIYYQTGPVYFSDKRYPRSLNLQCDSTSRTIIWDVAGYHSFSAIIGVDDSTSDATGGIAEMIFYDQDGRQLGKPVDVSLGHATSVALSLTGVVQLKVACAGRDAKTNDGREFYAAMGNAVITQ